MTHQEIKDLAGHRAVSPWIMKLVNDAVAKEREACAKRAEIALLGTLKTTSERVLKAIRARNKNEN